MTIAPICPLCRNVITADDINVPKDLAYCRRCNAGQALSGLINGPQYVPKVDLHNPPAGTWYRTDPLSIVIGASHRSWGSVLTYLGISLFWNGIVSVFVLVALSGTFHHLAIEVPNWFPAPKMNGETMGLGMLIFLWIFLTPFILIGLAMILGFISSLAGRTEIRIGSNRGSIFVGIGRLGWTRDFDPASVKEVSISERVSYNDEGNTSSQMEILLQEKSGKTIKFGSLLKGERQYFISSALRQILR